MNILYLRSYRLLRALVLYRCIYEYYKYLGESLAEANRALSALAAAKEKNCDSERKNAPGPKASNSQPALCPTVFFKIKSHWDRANFSYDLRQTHLYYYRARYYDPTTGRFLQYDPKGYYDSMNLYQAFNMNGINFLDPMGDIITFSGRRSRKLYAEFKKKLFEGEGPRFEEIKTNIKQLEDSDIEFKIHFGPSPIGTGSKSSGASKTGGATKLEGRNRKKVSVYVYDQRSTSYSNISKLAHELRHAYQFLTGDLSYYKPKDRSKWLAGSYDIFDEVEAFSDQVLFSTKDEFRNVTYGEFLTSILNAKSDIEKADIIGSHYPNYGVLLTKYRLLSKDGGSGRSRMSGKSNYTVIKKIDIDNGKRQMIIEKMANGTTLCYVIEKK
jgi:RHS repeat-associated protein